MDPNLTLKVLARDRYICQYCGKDGLASFDNWWDTVIDHFIPVSKGGTDEMENLKTSCRVCNTLKADKLFSSISEVIRFIQQERQKHELYYREVKAKILQDHGPKER